MRESKTKEASLAELSSNNKAFERKRLLKELLPTVQLPSERELNALLQVPIKAPKRIKKSVEP